VRARSRPEIGIGSPVQSQFADCAVLSHDRFVTLFDYVALQLGKCQWGETERPIVGGRFKLTGTGYMLPFYSVHIVPWNDDNRNDRRQRHQCNDVIDIVKASFRDGDLTPLVAGDFNFSRAFDPHDALIWKTSNCKTQEATKSWLLIRRVIIRVGHLPAPLN